MAFVSQSRSITPVWNAIIVCPFIPATSHRERENVLFTMPEQTVQGWARPLERYRCASNYYSSGVKMRRCQKGLLSEEMISLNKEMDDLGVKELRSGRKNKRHKKSKTRMLGEREPWPENRLDPQGLQMFRQELWEAWSLKHRKETASVSQNVGWLQNCLGGRWIADGNCGEAVWLSL